jgi:DNA-binding XRE family transcriptional regulator
MAFEIARLFKRPLDDVFHYQQEDGA